MFTLPSLRLSVEDQNLIRDHISVLVSEYVRDSKFSAESFSNLREEIRSYLDEIRTSNREFVDTLASLNARFESVVNNVLGYPDSDPNYPASEIEHRFEHRFESVISERLDSLTRIVEVLVNDVATKVRLSAEDYAELESGSVQRIDELKQEIHSLAVSLNNFRDEFRSAVSRKSGGQRP